MLDALLAAEVGEVPLTVAAGRVAECLPAGPGLAGWLASADPAELEDGALAGVAASFRRLASWAQAGELAAVAQIASRSAARDPKVTVAAGGRPGRIPDEAAAQVSLALVMSGYNADWWLDLAVTLTWRLAATGQALAAGTIDLPRARLIAEATSLLTDEDARTVEDQVLPRAGELTNAALRVALRRAVIAADPDGAERRRKQSEARAKICLYPDEEGTAALSGYSLPGIGAAAAMARISALARALKASVASGGIDLLRAQVFLGLLCGTLPLIRQRRRAPRTPPPAAAPRPDPAASGGAPGHGPGPRPGAGPGKRPAPRRGSPAGAWPVRTRPAGARPLMCHRPAARPRTSRPRTPIPAARIRARDMTPMMTGPGTGAPDTARSRTGRRYLTASPPPRAPAQDSRPRPPRRPGGGPGGPGGRRPGLLDLALPWTTLAGLTRQPGQLGRLGPISPAQACQLAAHAATDPGTDWRIILTSPAGQALAVTHIPCTRTRTAAAREAAGTGRSVTENPDHLPRPPGRRPPRQRHHRDPRPRPQSRRHRRPARRRPGHRRHSRRHRRPHHRHPPLPAPAPPHRIHHRPRPHLPVPALPPARLAQRPRPHPPLRRRRPDLPQQPRRLLPPRPHPQTPPRLARHPARPRHLPLDHPHRPHLPHHPRHPPHLAERWPPFAVNIGRRFRQTAASLVGLAR